MSIGEMTVKERNTALAGARSLVGFMTNCWSHPGFRAMDAIVGRLSCGHEVARILRGVVDNRPFRCVLGASIHCPACGERKMLVAWVGE